MVSRSKRSCIEAKSRVHPILLAENPVASAITIPTTNSREAFLHDLSPLRNDQTQSISNVLFSLVFTIRLFNIKRFGHRLVPACQRRFSLSQAIVGLLHYLCIEDIGWHFFPQYLSHVLSSFLLNGGDSLLRSRRLHVVSRSRYRTRAMDDLVAEVPG